MKYYKISTEYDDNFYIESKTDISDEEVFEQAVSENLIDPFSFENCSIEEISEEEYEENI
jgi:hypothetical protein